MENNSTVKIDVDFFISERKSKIWSQQHLADVAGVSLRTIQRIEKTGVTSAESLKAISSAYEKQPSFFLEVEKINQKHKKNLLIALAFGVILLMVLASNYLVFKEPDKVIFDVKYRAELLKSGDINESSWQIELDLDNELTLNLPNHYELVLLPYLGSDNEALIDLTFGYQNDIPLIPNTVPTTITKSLNKGISLEHEKEGNIIVAINIAMVES